MLALPQLGVTLQWVHASVLQGSQSFVSKLPWIGIVALLVAMAGMMSGLTLGLMSLSKVDLQMLIETGTPREKLYATRVMPLISNPHFLLCTLLLGNALAMEGLPLVLKQIVDPITAVIISVTFVLIAGEIVPQAICTRYGLAVGGVAAPFVYVVRFLFSPISWPIGKLLDWLVGHDDSALFRRPQLKAFVDLHGKDSGMGGTLMREEVQVIQGALDLIHKTAVEVMTPLDKVFMLCTEDILDETTLRRVLHSGHSRIPVYQHPNRLHIVGLIITKELARFDPAAAVPVKDVRMRTLPHLPSDVPLFDLLDLFQIGRSHMAVLCDPVVPFCDMYEDEKRSPGHSPAPSSPTRRPPAAAAANGGKQQQQQQQQQQAAALQAGHGDGRMQLHQQLHRQQTEDATLPDGGPDAEPDAVHITIPNSPLLDPSIARSSGEIGATSSGGSKTGRSGSRWRSGEHGAPPNGGDGENGGRAGIGGTELSPSTSHVHASTSYEQDELWELQGEAVGIITLEDVIEELLHTEIVDETDRYVDNEQTQRVNVGLLIKKLPPRLRQHLNAETLLPVLEQTKALSGRAPAQALGHSHPLSSPNLASPPGANPAAAGGHPIIRTTSWTRYKGSRSPRSTSSGASPRGLSASGRASSPQVETGTFKPTPRSLRPTMSEGGEAPAAPSEASSCDVSETSSLPFQPYIRRKVSFRLPPPVGNTPPMDDGLLGGGDADADAAATNMVSPFQAVATAPAAAADGASAAGSAAGGTGPPSQSPFATAAGIASSVVAAAVSVVTSGSSSVSEEQMELSEPLLLPDDAALRPLGSGPRRSGSGPKPASGL